MKRMLIDAMHPEEIRVVVVDGKKVIDFDFVSSSKKQVKGNIYLAKITRVEPSLQAAFVEYGCGKQGFLPFSEIHADYYQIPADDRKRLLEEAEAEAAAQEAANEMEQDVGSDTTNDAAVPPHFPEAPVDTVPKESYSLPLLKSASDAAELAPTHLQEGVSEPVVTEALSIAETLLDSIKESESETAEDGVETLAPEEEEVRAERKKRSFFKRYKIQEVIRRGQIVLVQVIKEERGNKGASLTTYLSLAGRYCVLMPNSPKDGGISRKIASPEDRKRLKAISTELRLAEGMSVIIRTAGMDRPHAEIKRDFDYLVKLWNHIRETTLSSNAPALIYEENDVIKRAIRDQYSNDMEDIIVQGEVGFESAREFMKLLLPSHVGQIKLHNETTPLLYAYDIEEQLMSMHDPVVKLKSGGYIVINPTEALISIDVNSGRSTGERNIEETAVKTNLEAAAEVGRQLRLRDLAGLIVIDFIDMLESRNRRAVEKAMKDVLKADRAKIQIGRISPFGLLEMSRQRLRPSIAETSMVTCAHCEGRGFIRSNESMSIQIIRNLEKEASGGNWGSLRLIAPQAIALHLLNHKRDMLKAMEERHNVSIQILIDVNLTASEFNLEKMRRAQAGPQQNERAERPERHRRPEKIADANEPSNDALTEEGSGNVEVAESERKNSRRGRRGGRNRNNRDRGLRNVDNANVVAQEGASVDSTGAVTTVAEGEAAPQADNNNPRERRPRGGRGGRGRRNWRENDRGNSDNQPTHTGESNVVNISEAPQTAPLPAFTQRAAVEPPPVPSQVVNLHGDTPRDPSAQPKRGWWQRMINLDD